MRALLADLRAPPNALCTRRFLKLTTHPRMKRIHRNPRTHSFVVRLARDTQRVLPGVHARLGALLWPHTSDAELAGRARGPRTRVERERARQPRTCATHGLEHGALVHHELDRYVSRVLSRGAAPPDEADPCTARVLRMLAAERLLPVATEVPVFDERAGVATAIDMIAIHVDRLHLVAVELKTGYEQTDFDAVAGRDYGRLCWPLHTVENTPLARAHAQLLTCMAIVRQRYGVTFDDGCVVRVCSRARTASLHPLPPWARDPRLVGALYAQLCDT